MLKKSLFSVFFGFLLLVAGCRTECVRQSVTPPCLKMMLPEVVYAAPGIESNIYFDYVIDSATPWAYAFEVKCKRGTHGNKRWFWTPGKEDAGKSFDLELRVFNDYGRILTGKCKVVVAGDPADFNKKITLALLADSGTNSDYPRHLMKTMRQNGFVNYTPVGKHSGGGRPVVPGGLAHDGYGGFSWNCFLNRWYYLESDLPKTQTQAEREQFEAVGIRRNVRRGWEYMLRSPLIKIVNGKKTVDIPGWFKDVNQGKAPDFILIQLGGNDMFSAKEHDLEQRITKIMGNARKLITVLRKHAPDSVIGITSCPLGCSQDGFGANYKCSQSHYQYSRNMHRYNRALDQLIREFKDEKIKLIPLHHVLDPQGSFLQKTYPVFARSSKKIVRDSNALHFSKEGGYQVGDAIYCWLRKQLEK